MTKKKSWQLPPKAVHIAEAEYIEPADDLIGLLETDRPPQVLVDATRRHVALVARQGLIGLERLSRPVLGLAGLRIDPANSTLAASTLATSVKIQSIDNPDDLVEVVPPEGALFADVVFSPKGSRIALTVVFSDHVDLAIYSLDTQDLALLNIGPLNAVWGAPCSWIADTRLLCRRRGHPGEPARVEMGPKVQELLGGSAPVLTYPNLLRDPNDDELFEYYGHVDLVFVTADGEVSPTLVEPGLIPQHALSPSGEYLLVTRMKPPFPRIVPIERFPRDVELHDVEQAKKVRTLHVDQSRLVQSRGVPLGPRMFRWDPLHPSEFIYVSRRHGEEFPPEDRIWRVSAADPNRSPIYEGSFADVQLLEYTSRGTLLLVDRAHTSHQRLYRLGKTARLLVEVEEEGVGLDLGRLMRVNGPRGSILEHDDHIWVHGTRPGPQGAKPFVERLHLRTGKSAIAHASRTGWYEEAIAVLNPEKLELLISVESPTVPPALFVANGLQRHPLTRPGPIHPLLRGIEQRLIHYQRADGVKLSAMLYLPAGYRRGRPVPTVLWIYPRDFSEEIYASQAITTADRYFDLRDLTRFTVLTRGYALLDSPAMPIVGSRQSAQSDYVKQLVASAEAAVGYLVRTKIADPHRIAVVGRSYGAFAAANLMAHSRLFRTAIAMSGAYNRTLTPFGFQGESRSFWQRQEAYVNMSPFFFADRMRDPILLIHGESDENPGTPAMQSERFFAALVGNGVPSRYVSLPFEGHYYRARSSVLHIVAEMLMWLDRHMLTDGGD